VHFGIVIDQPVADIPLRPGRILLVTPAVLRHPRIRRHDRGLVYDLLTGHPSRTAGGLVFLVDLTQELWAWDGSTWASVDVDPGQVCDTIAQSHRLGHIDALRVDDLTAEELHALTQLPMAARRDALRRRLRHRLSARDLH
jgi:hypothetical protein